ncbi:MAG: PQQ-binding-like beta-propeller repeat protein [Planctomycetota bacterium]|nr:PQQ-binding-like beta-propeller repeat protein [Planctomycetota bacterium]
MAFASKQCPECRAACVIDDEQPPKIREWHFTRLQKRKFKYGFPVWASPAIAIVEGSPMAFFGGYDNTLHALDLAAKQERWFKVTNGPITAPPAVGSVEDIPVVFFGSSDRSVYAHLAYDGTLLWSRELVEPTPTIGQSIVCAPLVQGDTLYVTCFSYDRSFARNDQRGWLFALKKDTGRLLWKVEVSQGPVSSPTGAYVDGKYTVFVAARKGLLSAIDVSQTEPARLWEFQMPHEVMGSPAVLEGDRPMLFLGSKFGNIIALDARTGERIWKRMAGNWIDNTACIGEIGGEPVVFVGSHDYNVYAFKAIDGEFIWRRHLGGEVFSAPAFFYLEGEPALTVASLDNHTYVLNATDGKVTTSYYTGKPIWDTISKGDVLWGSPAVLQAGRQTAVLTGSYNGHFYVLPVYGKSELRAKVRSASSLWIWLIVVAGVFLLVVLPIVIILGPVKSPEKRS